MQVGGTLLKPVLTGRVTLGRTEFYVGAGSAQARVEQVELTPEELRALARDFGPAMLKNANATPGLMDRAKLDLAVRMPGRVWIRRNTSPKTDIELMGNVQVTQQPGQEMQFSGHVEPVPNRGTLELNGKQFRLTDGDIYLAGPVDSTNSTSMPRTPCQPRAAAMPKACSSTCARVDASTVFRSTSPPTRP